MGDIYTNPPQSRNEAILRATIDGTEYTAPPQSRIEDLLLELKEAIEEGGGSVESYEQLTNKPQINGTTLSGDKSTEDLIPIDKGLEFDSDGKIAVSLGGGLAFNSDGEIDNLTEANPSDSATGELSKLKVGSDIYSVVTKAVNDLTNYYTKSEVYTKAEVNNIAQARFAVVAQLPTEDIQTNVIYLVPKSTAQTNNDYDEYIYALKITNPETYGWEKIGDTEIDLSDYVTTQALNTALADYTTTTDLTTLLAGKEPTISVTANRALVSDANGKVSASSATSEEVGYLSGVTGAIQTQIDGKASQSDMTSVQSKIVKIEDSIHPHIYGVKWDWANSSSSALTRTDLSRYFANPSPAVNNGTGSSPFDLIYPWCDMQEIEDAEAGTLISIPKFWYKMTNTDYAYTLQIADAPADGFHVSPAHIDRGDGKGERDVVFVGRYHCDSNYQSKSGSQPIGGITRATARTNIHALGNTIYQFDYLTMWTIRLLYLVEFANFDSQTQIGYGCSPNGEKFNMGYTDSMQYHTGTTQSTRSTYGGTQYRHIEGLWDNVVDFVDGMYYTTDSTYIIKNPSLFGESGGVSIGSKVGAGSELSGNNSVINYAISQDGIPCPIGAEVNDTNFTKYTCDKVTGRSNGVILLCGGAYGQNRTFGLFNDDSWQEASLTGASVGCRLIKLP